MYFLDKEPDYNHSFSFLRMNADRLKKTVEIARRDLAAERIATAGPYFVNINNN